MVDANRRITTRDIAKRLNLSNATFHKHMNRLGLIYKLVIVVHVRTERNLLRRSNEYDTLIRRQRNDPFLKRIVTGNEKRVVHNNVKRKISWSKKDQPAQTTSKSDIHHKMFSVWWDFKGIVYFELLPDNTTINSEVYCNQLDKLSDALKEKRPELVNRKGVVFYNSSNDIAA